MARLIDRQITLDLSGFKEAEEAFKRAAESFSLSSEDFKRISESFCAPEYNWASLKMPEKWDNVNTIMASGDWYRYHKSDKHNTYSILTDNYEIHIVYNMPTDDLYMRIFNLSNGNNIEYDHITKEYLYGLFDINNLLYQVDNRFICIQCGEIIIDNGKLLEHKELCIANILEDLEDNWIYISWMR